MAPPVMYNDLLKDMSNKFNYRFGYGSVCQRTQHPTGSLSFRYLKAHCAKWLLRYDRYGSKGLEDLSGAPKVRPNKIPKELEENH
ncbi:MAG: hypothetical protein NC912_01115 [Candidatus Omnitrophica bacterium]|nr:hypothetical protein [Candidatus Omnitrophota bacterium]